VNLIWATRGRSWGFRFLLDGGLSDPLSTYERAFDGAGGERTHCRQVGSHVAVRFPDPLGRLDKSGRVIPHDIVVESALATGIRSAEDGLRIIWPLLAPAFEKVWDRSDAPSRDTVLLAFRDTQSSSEIH
jgi:hypothetical protein